MSPALQNVWPEICCACGMLLQFCPCDGQSFVTVARCRKRSPAKGVRQKMTKTVTETSENTPAFWLHKDCAIFQLWACTPGMRCKTWDARSLDQPTHTLKEWLFKLKFTRYYSLWLQTCTYFQTACKQSRLACQTMGQVLLLVSSHYSKCLPHNCMNGNRPPKRRPTWPSKYCQQISDSSFASSLNSGMFFYKQQKLSLIDYQSEGREWGVGSVVVEFCVFGAPQFSVQSSQNTHFKGFGENRGAPKTQKSTTTDPTPHSRPSESTVLHL